MVLEAGCRAHTDDRITVTDVDPAVQYTALTGCLPGRQQARDASALQHSGSLIACTCFCEMLDFSDSVSAFGKSCDHEQ